LHAAKSSQMPTNAKMICCNYVQLTIKKSLESHQTNE
jgi:hypothetical protein